MAAEQEGAERTDKPPAPAQDADAQLQLLERHVFRVALQAAPDPSQRLVVAADVLARQREVVQRLLAPRVQAEALAAALNPVLVAPRHELRDRQVLPRAR